MKEQRPCLARAYHDVEGGGGGVSASISTPLFCGLMRGHRSRHVTRITVKSYKPTKEQTVKVYWK